MKLERLDIGGFGRLRDVSIEFAPRVTVILGDNESGKTTLQRAVRAALYGLDAGGQGRPVERSDWYRWRPWVPGPFGFALTYVLLDGNRRFRVAARLDDRDQHVEVREVGGGDVTVAMRQGRLVAPGRVHLGIDETVFCATAWLDEDGLRIGALDAPAQRAIELQEAIERLADSGAGVTAVDAMARLTEAAQRVGSERRSSSPLGVATTRLHQVESQLAEARRRIDAVSAEQQRLRELESAASSAEQRRRDCEIRWLRGKLGAIGTQRAELIDAEAEIAGLERVLRDTEGTASFPIGDEERVISLASEQRHAVAEVTASQDRWDEGSAEIANVRARRAEISLGLAALAVPARVDASLLTTVQRLEAGVEADIAARDHLADVGGGDKATALRQEVAATGLASVPLGGAAELATLVDTALNANRHPIRHFLALLIALGGFAAALDAEYAHRTTTALLVVGAATLVVVATFIVSRLRAGEAAHARRQLRRMAPDIDHSSMGLARLAERLPALDALHAEIARDETMSAAREEQRGVIDDRITAAAAAATSLLARCGLLDRVRIDAQPTAEARTRIALSVLRTAIEESTRRRELEDENDRLARREQELAVLEDDAARRIRDRDDIEFRLRRLLDRAGVPSDMPTALAVAAFRTNCATRRKRESAMEALALAKRRASLLGNDPTLSGLAIELSRELRERSIDPGDIEPEHEALDPTSLAALEREVEHSRQAAVSASAAASNLRERIAGQLDHLPSVADLEDERQACTVARDRAQHQLAALRKATEVLEATTRSVHRDLAPQLAASIAERLALLTSGRYEAVNVDTDHFAVTLLSRERPDLIPLDAVSHGTRDQVGLLLRLALVDVLGTAGEPIPLLLDEPLLTADPSRREAALEFFARVADRHQLIITTTDPAFANAVINAAGEGSNIAQLAPIAEEMTPFETTGSLSRGRRRRAARLL